MSLNMTVEEKQAFLADLHVGILSIPRKDRAPLTVPIWYDYEPGGEVWMLTHPDSLKGKALLNCDKISLCVQTETAPYQYVSVEGCFSITDPSAGDNLGIATRYLGEEGGKQYASGSTGDNIKVNLNPDTWLSIDYSKM